MSMKKWGKEEIERAGLFDKDNDYEGLLGEAIEELWEVFCNQNHSGFSAKLVAQYFHYLVKNEPLTPLTGEESEWVKVDDYTWQNKRCSRVFSEDKGKTGYDLEGRIFVNENGNAFISKESQVEIEFPYVPTQKIIREGSPEAEEYTHLF